MDYSQRQKNNFLKKITSHFGQPVTAVCKLKTSLKRKDENKLLVCEDLTVGPPGGFKPLNNIRLANSHVVLATGHVAVPLCEGERPVTGDVLTLHRL